MGGLRTLNIEHIEAELYEYFSSVEYLPAEVKKCAALMAQDLSGSVLAGLIAAHGGDVNWSDGSFQPRGVGGPWPLGYSPVTWEPKG